MNFSAIEQRARAVAEEAAVVRTDQIRDMICKEVGIGTVFGGPPEDFRKAWAPMAAHLHKLLTQRNLIAYHNQAEQAAIDALKSIINSGGAK